MFTLALRLGMTVCRLEDEMPYEELVDWMAYFDLRAAQQAGIPLELTQMSADEIFGVFDRLPHQDRKPS